MSTPIEELKDYTLLYVNGVPITFRRSMISKEMYTLKNNVKTNTFIDKKPIVIPDVRTLEIKLTIPNSIENKAYYDTAREIIRVLHFLFSQREVAVGPNEPRILPGTDVLNTGKKLPWAFPATCAYLGINISMAFCIIKDFIVESYPNSSTEETWTLKIEEVNIGQFDKQYLDDRIKVEPKTEKPKPAVKPKP